MIRVAYEWFLSYGKSIQRLVVQLLSVLILTLAGISVRWACYGFAGFVAA